MADDEKAIQYAKRERRYGKEIHGSNGIAMIPQEGQPAMGRIRRSHRSSKPS
jgi:hypothetical protein